MAIYLITHADRFGGYDPGHTEEGLVQIEKLPLPANIKLIISGTGKRFLEILEIVRKKLPNVSVKYSSFCGGTEGYEDKGNGTEQIILADRTINLNTDYIDVSNGPLNMWDFVKSLPDETLLCAGGALMIGLGLKGIYEKGHLYELDHVNETGKLIA